MMTHTIIFKKLSCIPRLYSYLLILSKLPILQFFLNNNNLDFEKLKNSFS